MADETQDTQDGELFPAANFDDPDLQLPLIDGKKVDEIAIRFSGSILLDRTNKTHVAYFRDVLKLGAEVELRDMDGVVQQKPARQAATKDGYAGGVRHTAVVKIHTIGGLGTFRLADE